MYENLGIGIEKPETKLENGELGMKVSAYSSFGDFSLYGYYGWEDAPAMTGKFERLVMAGFSFAVPVGEVTFKGEGAWYPKRDEVAAGSVGLEWIKGDFTLVAEAYGTWNRQKDCADGQVAMVLKHDFLDGDLQLTLSGIVEFVKYDEAIQAGASYAVSDEMKMSAKATWVFEGPEEAGTYGAFKELDSVKVSATYSF